MAAALAALSGVSSSLAVLSTSASTAGGGITVASDWVPPTVAGQMMALNSDTTTGGVLRRGSRFYVYANVVDPGTANGGIVSVTADVGSVATGQTTVTLTPGTYTFPTGGATFAYRSAVLTTKSTLTPGTYSWKVTTLDGVGQTTVTTATVEISTTYVFMGSSGHGATNCRSNTLGRYDMELGYVPNGPELSRTGSDSSGRVTFCSDTFSASASIPSGTTRVTLIYANASPTRSCDITVALLRNNSTLGSQRRTIPAGTATTEGTWQFSTASASFSTGDRLSVSVEFRNSNCNATTFYWNSPEAASKAVIP